MGRKVDVVSAEGLVLMKLRAYLSDSESADGVKHRADVMKVVQAAKLDIDALRAFVRSDPPLRDELERVLAAPRPKGRLGWREPQ
jgi:hypothetical protein